MTLRLAGLFILAVGAPVPACADSPVTGTAAAEASTRGFTLAPGLKLTVWAAEPQLQNGVAFSFDARGRCFIAETHRYKDSIFDITQRTNWLLNDLSFQSPADRAEFLDGQFSALQPDLLTRNSESVRVVEDRSGGGRADHSAVFATGFNSPVDGTAAGVLARDGHVWFANVPNLWRLDRPVTGELASGRTQIAHGFGVHIGVTGHDAHGVIRGPDGRIYLSFGDRGLDVRTLTNFTAVSPRLATLLRDTGGVLRCEPDGTGVELFCHGLRNPQELAFDDLGNLWTVDNDTAGADPCRVLHLVEGADYGWRCSYQHQEGFGPWVKEELWRGDKNGTLPPAGTVSQGPSGLTYYPGTGWGSRWTGKFLHCDFPGGILAYSVKPAGASYVVAEKEKVLWNCWPTDVDFGPDGALYVLDWVSGWQMPDKGRIFRITDPAHAEDPPVAEVKRFLAAGFKQLPAPELITRLGHADRRVRLEAQWELGARGVDSLPLLVPAARTATRETARLHALWGVGMILRAAPLTVGTEALSALLPLLSDPSPEIRGQAALTLLGDGRLLNAEAPVAALLSDESPRVRLQAMQAFVRRYRAGGLNSPVFRRLEPASKGHIPVLELTRLLESEPPDAFLRDAAAQLMTCLLTHDLAERWSISTNENVRYAALLAFRRQGRATISAFLSDASSRLVIEAGRAIYEEPITVAWPALAKLLTRIDCPPELYSRSLAANVRLNTGRNATAIANFAARADVPPATRALAIHSLGTWADPGPLDPVNGLWHPAVAVSQAAEPRTSDGEAREPENPALLARAATAPLPGPSSRFEESAGLPTDLGRSTTYAAGLAVRRKDGPAKRAFLARASGYVATGEPTLQLAVLSAVRNLGAREAATPLMELFNADGTSREVRAAIAPTLAAVKSSLAEDAVRRALADLDSIVRASALPHLDRLSGDGAMQYLTGMVTPTARRSDPVTAQAAYAALAKLETGTADQLLVEALSALLRGELPAELRLDVTTAAARRAGADSGIATRLNEYQARLNKDLPDARFQDTLAGGSIERGRAIFFQSPTAQCLRCHLVGPAGGSVGPKLDGVGKLRDRAYLLTSIIRPNQTYADGFAPAPGGLSAMPEGYGDILTPVELRDLVEFLASLR